MADNVVILVCEDDRMRESCAGFLGQLGYAVEDTEDSRIGLALAIRAMSSVVLVGVSATRRHDLELCRLLACGDETRHTPVVALVEDEAMITHAIAAGVRDVLKHPPDAGEWRRVIDRLRAHTPPAPSPTSEAAPRVRRRRAAESRTVISNESPTFSLECPDCGERLIYRHTFSAGFERTEHWDVYTCPGHCGSFRYRRRTRVLSPMPSS